MKTFLYLIVISSFLSFSCVKVESTGMKEFKCSFIGDNTDIISFLGIEDVNIMDNVNLQVFANQFVFLKENESLKIYGFDENTDILETFKLKEISTQLKTDRKYKMHLLDSSDTGFKMKIESGDKTFTQMRGSSIVIECMSLE